jgi:phospholipid-binding lipoprotein MlaA
MRAARYAAAVAVGIALALGGCATDGVAIHREPAETPAADQAAAARSAAEFSAATAAAPDGSDAAAMKLPPVTTADVPSMTTYDPWEGMNRFIYRFNARFDEAVFRPVANVYRRLPAPVRAGVHNFFGNLSEVDSVINYALQGRAGPGVRSLGRFAVNTTLGLGGLFDVAKKLKLPAAPTGFSATLGTWGLHPGPYLVIPLLGPSTLRDGAGFLGDFGASYGVNIANLYRGDQSWALDGVNAVDERANTSFRYYATGSAFEYEIVRFLYVRKRLLEDAVLHRSRPLERPPPGEAAGK